MTDTAAGVAACRTCGGPRGENIAHGTRCARCGHRQAVMLWIATAIGAGNAAFAASRAPADAAVACIVALIVAPPAFVLAVLLHELTHAGIALALGQTVTRVLVGEGRALARLGRDPQIVFGSVLVGNGLTTVMDLRRRGYLARDAVMSLTAPLVSALVAIAAWTASGGWPLPARTAALVLAFPNLALAAITLMPVPTFGGRVWSDLAHVLYLRRGGERAIEEQMLASVQDRMAILLEADLAGRAILTARAGVEAVPRDPLAYSLLAYVLHRTGHLDEAAAVARSALDLASDDATRAYLGQFVRRTEASADATIV